MGRNSVYQEILLIRGTSFVTRLPEIFSEAPDGRGFFLWQIKEAESLLVLELGEAPTGVDGYSSIVPYLFVAAQNHS